MLISRPFLIFKLSDELRSEPYTILHFHRREANSPSPFLRLREIGERTFLHLKRLHFLQQIRSRYRGKAITSSRYIEQLALVVVSKKLAHRRLSHRSYIRR
jgi:hypothetical protein